MTEEYTVNGLKPQMKLEEAERLLGKLIVDSSLPQETQSAMYFQGNHRVSVFVYREGPRDRRIDRVEGTSLEAAGKVLVELGFSETQVADCLGFPHGEAGQGRKFWSYKKLGKNKLDISIMFDEGLVTNIETIWKPPGW